MKVATKGKQIQVTMTVNQLEAIMAALDSVSYLVNHGATTTYKDIEQVELSLSKAINKAKERGEL